MLLELDEAIAVVKGGIRIVDGAGTYNDEKTAVGVGVLHDMGTFVAAFEDCLFRGLGLGNLVLEEVGGCERVVAANAPVFGGGLVANVGVGLEELEGVSMGLQCGTGWQGEAMCALVWTGVEGEG